MLRFGAGMRRQYPTAKEQHRHYQADNPKHRSVFPFHNFYRKIISGIKEKSPTFFSEPIYAYLRDALLGQE
jgi:hypothetical protein